MRKQLRSALIASAALTMLAIHPSWATPDDDRGPNPNADEHFKKQPHHHDFEAPEIDVGAGGAGLTVFAIDDRRAASDPPRQWPKIHPSWATPDDDRQAASGPPRQWPKIHPSWARLDDDWRLIPNTYEHFEKRPHHHFEAPEIDVGAGGAGLTVLTIALLLAAERRSRAS